MASWFVDRQGGPSSLFVLLASLLGVCLMGSSIYFFALSGEDIRSGLVGDYDVSVQYWEAVGRAEFLNVACTVANITGSGVYELKAQTANDRLLDSSQKDLPEFTALSYGYNGSIAQGIMWDHDARVYVADVTFTCGGGAAQQVSTITLPSVSFFMTTTQIRANQKQCRYQYKGSWYNNRCEVYKKLKGLCIKVSLEGGQWQLNNTWGGSGCQKRDGWSQAVYQQVVGRSTAFGHGTPPAGLVDLSELQVQVRSGVDPYLDAEELTNDTLSFGATSWQETVIGCVLLVGGVVMSIPGLTRLLEWLRRKHQGHEFSTFSDRQTNDVSNPLQDDLDKRGQPRQSAFTSSSFGGMLGNGRSSSPVVQVGL